MSKDRVTLPEGPEEFRGYIIQMARDQMTDLQPHIENLSKSKRDVEALASDPAQQVRCLLMLAQVSASLQHAADSEEALRTAIKEFEDFPGDLLATLYPMESLTLTTVSHMAQIIVKCREAAEEAAEEAAKPKVATIPTVAAARRRRENKG